MFVGVACCGVAVNAWPRAVTAPVVVEKKCHFLDTNPFFKTPEGAVDYNSKSPAAKQHFKDELVFLTEFARFMNKKAPELLQVIEYLSC